MTETIRARRRHPSEETWAARDANQLPPGALGLMEMHAELCGQCAKRMGTSAPPDPPRALDVVPLQASVGAGSPFQHSAALARWRFARFLRLGRRLRIARLLAGAGIGEEVYLVEATGAISLPVHTHSGAERTLVLRGAYADGDDLYGAGDFAESGLEQHHQPRVLPGAPCVCLIATDGPLIFTGWRRFAAKLAGF